MPMPGGNLSPGEETVIMKAVIPEGSLLEDLRPPWAGKPNWRVNEAADALCLARELCRTESQPRTRLGKTGLGPGSPCIGKAASRA